MHSLGDLLQELRRRHVFRVALLYAAVGWLLIQVADTVLPRLYQPDWTVTLVIVLVGLGFPVALVLAWAFDLTPGGVVRAESRPGADREEADGPAGASASRVPPPTSASTPALTAVRLGRLAVVAVVLVATLGGASLFLLRSDASALPPDTVLVARFENRTGDAAMDPIGAMVADWLAQGFDRVDWLHAIPSTVALLSDGPGQGVTELDAARSMAAMAGAGTVVTGAYYFQGGQLHFQAHVYDVSGGRLLRSLEPVIGLAEDPMPSLEALRQRAVGAVAYLLDRTLSERDQVAGPMPTLAAYRAYVEAVEQFFSTGAASLPALEGVRAAVSADSMFAPARLMQVSIHLNRGEEAAADSALAALAPLIVDATPGQRAMFETYRMARSGDLDGAVRPLRTLRNPDPVMIYLHGLYAIRAHRPREAVEILERMDTESLLANRWGAYWNVLAIARHRLGDHRGQLEAAREYGRRFPESVAAVGRQAEALGALGRLAEVGVLADSLKAMGSTFQLRSLASDLYWHDHDELAREVGLRALELARLGAERSGATGGDSLALGATLFLVGEHEEAARVLGEVRTSYPESLDALGWAGVVAARTGSETLAGEIRTLLAAWDEPYLYGAHHRWLARVHAQSGDAATAVAAYQRSFAEGAPFGDEHLAPFFLPIRDDPGVRRLLEPRG